MNILHIVSLRNLIGLVTLGDEIKEYIGKDSNMNKPDFVYYKFLKWEADMIRNGWSYLGCGRHRRVIRKGNIIIKIPYRFDGIEANKSEHNLYRRYRRENKYNYAPCRLLKNNCLLMWYVYPMEFWEAPSWACELSDGIQVGRYKDGRILVYDYSDEFLPGNIKEEIKDFVTKYTL
jgi:hypothetical protein